jgi:hypothetical protein
MGAERLWATSARASSMLSLRSAVFIERLDKLRCPRVDAGGGEQPEVDDVLPGELPSMYLL